MMFLKFRIPVRDAMEIKNMIFSKNTVVMLICSGLFAEVLQTSQPREALSSSTQSKKLAAQRIYVQPRLGQKRLFAQTSSQSSDSDCEVPLNAGQQTDSDRECRSPSPKKPCLEGIQAPASSPVFPSPQPFPAIAPHSPVAAALADEFRLLMSSPSTAIQAPGTLSTRIIEIRTDKPCPVVSFVFKR